MNNSLAIIADKIFTGDAWLTQHAIVVTGNIIADIVPVSSIKEGITVNQLSDCIVAPAFIDLQIYGAHKGCWLCIPNPPHFQN